jgi:hypothetical protein
MHFHKDIIIRIISGVVFFGFTFMVLAPLLLEYLKKKLPGQYANDTDLDTLIRRQKERLRSQYGLSGDSQIDRTTTVRAENTIKSSSEIQKLFHETHWGGGTFSKELQSEISKKFSYTLADSKINAFINLCERRHYLSYLSGQNSQSQEAIKNYLVAMLILSLMLEEAKDKQFYILNKIASKIHVSTDHLALAVQIKLLKSVSLLKNLKDERIFEPRLVLSQYSDDTLRTALEYVAKNEGNIWAKNSSMLFEEMSLALNYSSILFPLPKLKNKKDLDTACLILGITKDLSLEEIKKTYKKIALLKHPDKILSQKLPLILEKKSIEQFNQIQEAYEVITSYKNKGAI